MPISGYFDIPFATAGDVTAIPEATQISGSVSYTQGFPVLYSTAVGSGGFNFPRNQFNQLMLDITTALQKLQQGSAPAFITSTMNGGSPFSYPAYAMASLGGVTYISLVGSNTDTPPTSKWQVLPLGTELLAANNLDDVANTTTALSNLGGLSSSTAASTYLAISTAASTYAPKASPALTGTPTAPTASSATSTTQLATTQFVNQGGLSLGTSTATTQTTSDSSTKIATTAFVQANKVMTALGVGSIITAHLSSGSVAAGSTTAAANLTPCYYQLGTSGAIVSSGDSITGTWQALVSIGSSNSNDAGPWQRTV